MVAFIRVRLTVNGCLKGPTNWVERPGLRRYLSDLFPNLPERGARCLVCLN
jgi:hypothetical protein